VVWIKTSGVKVQANFGQEPFLFEFVSTLPEGYLEGMEHMESKAKVMTIQEIKRRTQAEELMMMMGVFPLELCVVCPPPFPLRTLSTLHWIASSLD
jgi:hypothetical protein